MSVDKYIVAVWNYPKNIIGIYHSKSTIYLDVENMHRDKN